MSSHEDQEPYSPSPAPLSEDEMDFEDNGLRFDGIPQGLEKIWDYVEDGHHPVCLNDRLGDRGQFQVIHKLGSGGYANVWLCRVLDANPSEYIALKILMADSSGADCPERTILQFQQLVQDEPTVAKYFSLPLHQFQIDGPNGTHLCFVYPLAGPAICPNHTRTDDPTEVLREVSCQVAGARAIIHRVGLCHGDFRPANILFRTHGINGLVEDEPMHYLGDPRITNVVTASGEASADPRAPPYLVYPVLWPSGNSSLVSNQISVIDFGEAFTMTDPPEDLGIPLDFAAPETLCGNQPGPASDIWALPCTLFEIRTGSRLFSLVDHSEDTYIPLVIETLGQFPDEWWSKCLDRTEYPPDEPFKPTGNPDSNIRSKLKRPVFHLSVEAGSTIHKRVFIPEEEQELFADLLESMFQYDVAKRPSTEEVLQHPWFYFISRGG